jgi:hypothetical protein
MARQDVKDEVIYPRIPGELQSHPGTPAVSGTGRSHNDVFEVLSRLKPGDSCLPCGGGLDAP